MTFVGLAGRVEGQSAGGSRLSSRSSCKQRIRFSGTVGKDIKHFLEYWSIGVLEKAEALD
jgi:hypothetical protein